MNDSAKGWFEIDGVQAGDRTLAEQLKGLEAALAEAAGRTVVDFGCAEGLIAREFARAGAASVFAIDYKAEFIDTANALPPVPGATQPRFVLGNLADLIRNERAGGEVWRYDIVLALAIVHKLPEPTAALEFMADCARSLLVIRLPIGSTGAFVTKSGTAHCDTVRTMKRKAFNLERSERGPRGELVHYWRRR